MNISPTWELRNLRVCRVLIWSKEPSSLLPEEARGLPRSSKVTPHLFLIWSRYKRDPPRASSPACFYLYPSAVKTPPCPSRVISTPARLGRSRYADLQVPVDQRAGSRPTSVSSRARFAFCRLAGNARRDDREEAGRRYARSQRIGDGAMRAKPGIEISVLGATA